MLARPHHHSSGVAEILSPLIFSKMVKLVKPVLSLCFLHHRGLSLCINCLSTSTTRVLSRAVYQLFQSRAVARKSLKSSE